MRRKIQNGLMVSVEGADMEEASQIEFYVRQGPVFFSYTPQVISSEELYVEIPFADAMQLETAPVQLQFAFVDGDGNPRASGIVELFVGDFLKEAGYDPI